MGGHAVPEATIRRRYHAGLKNFFNLYKPITDSWQLYDNSNTNQCGLIASEVRGDTQIIKERAIWKQLSEVYHDE